MPTAPAHPPFAAGDRVMVRFDHRPTSWSPCSLHLADEFQLFQQVGKVDRIDPRYSPHSVIVEVRTVACPILGTSWVDSFTPGELVLVEPRYAF